MLLDSRRGFQVARRFYSHENPLGLPKKNSNTSGMSKGLPIRQNIPGVKKVLLVASGKGGVGKSTVAVNLALSLQKLNLKTGLLDADIFGPSIPKLMNLRGEPRLSNNDGKLLPLVNYGIETMSMGYLISQESSAIVWRGLMVMKALQQLLFDVKWNDLDVLVIDMPPGTGDTQLTISQQVKVNGAIIVSTPQDIALIDAIKGITMFKKVNIPIMGMVENMSYFKCPNCNHESHIFGGSGIKKNEATKEKIELLGEIPLDEEICLNSDSGKPIVLINPNNEISKKYLDIADQVKRKLLL
ncbi:hypothetical protein PACTADRAFT_46429 [Pachysolen tannophilus NRRL Y-2460]|uniref:Uncharacterized protein n=1 Tax=Pachysolen tannophilus NRRL Y-2460 TaxID=669874 RepID=A0A1E4TNW9_PACTA|nr:hypothetical protein PACTADRAFT_46429 [Pachysolen tannophilus NRRL Y-2460]